MIPLKIQCGSGQRYAFDVEPVDGRMPSSVACPAYDADGTAAANEIIARSSPPPPLAATSRPHPIEFATARASSSSGRLHPHPPQRPVHYRPRLRRPHVAQRICPIISGRPCSMPRGS